MQLRPEETVMKSLTPEIVRQYAERGYYAPIRVLSAEAAGAVRMQLESYEARHGLLQGNMRQKSHLLFTWLDEVIRHPAILDAVEDVIGPDILCWGTTFFTKEPRNPAFVSWHQDSTYWGLEPADIITAWVALSDSNAANGAMRVMPGTHLMDQVAHRDTFASDNLLSRGQEIAVEVDEREAAMLELRAGEMSLHHVRLIHGSDPNPSDQRRIGFAIRYIPTYVRQSVGGRDHATLVRGIDRHHNFAPERPPVFDMAPDAVAFHAAVIGEHTQILMRDTGRQMRA